MSDNEFSEKMDMEDFVSMLEVSLKKPTRGSTVKGTIAQIQGNQVIVNIGTKTEGMVDKSELPENITIGDEFEFVVVGQEIGDYIKLSSSKAEERLSWDNIAGAVGSVVKATIISHSEKGGYRAKVGQMPAFIPENHIDIKSKVKEPSYYIGKTLPAVVLKVSESNKPLLISPKENYLRQARQDKKNFLESIKEGDLLEGKVKTLKDYGAFITFGALDGFLHRSNISWGKSKSPANFLEVGDAVTVKVLSFDIENNKLEVGLKQVSEDPWMNVEERFPLDSVLQASVIGRRRAGYIAEVEPGIDAFIPQEELYWIKSQRGGALQPKDKVEGKVIGYDNDRKRIIISLKAMKENPWETIKREHPEGSILDVKVKNITDFGIFVDLNFPIDGLIRKKDISWVEDPKDLTALYSTGDTIKARMMKLDESFEHINLSIKHLEPNPWKDFVRNGMHKVYDLTVTEITKFEINGTLPNGLIGTIPLSEIPNESLNISSVAVGDVITAMTFKIDPNYRLIGLSVKKLLTDNERNETKEYMKRMEKSEESRGFGNIFKDKLK